MKCFCIFAVQKYYELNTYKMSIFEFLNEQSDTRLVGYGIFILWGLYYIMQGLVYIAQCVFSKSKENKNKHDEHLYG